MQALREVNDDKYELEFYGYGGEYMKGEGFNNDFDIDIDQFDDKAWHTYRKSRTNNINNHYKWNPFNLVNKGFMTNSDHVVEEMNDTNLAKRIFQSRPDLILNIGNEYLTMQLMD